MTLEPILKDSIIPKKESYPYLTFYKKEPYKSFLLIGRREVGNFYFSALKNVEKLYQHYNNTILNEKTLNLENIYWFLLFRKFIKKDKKEQREGFYKIIKRCEIHEDGKLGFKFSPHSKQKVPDIWSTYFALGSLKLLGLLKEYLASKGRDHIKREIKTFIFAHKIGDGFLHCLDKNCPIEKKTSPARTLYIVLELLILLGIDIRSQRSLILPLIGERKKDSSLIYKLLCLKYLNADSETKEREILNLLQYQQEDGGFNFKSNEKVGKISTTFWTVNALQAYSWIVDYNTSRVYSFINLKLYQLLTGISNPNTLLLMKLSQLIILLSLIWVKFINEIEETLYYQLEKDNFIDIEQLKKSFGLSSGIEEIISYINLNYTFKLKILDNKIEFRQFLRNLSSERANLGKQFYSELVDNKSTIVSFKRVLKDYKKKYKDSSLKSKELNSILISLMKKNLIKGKISKKKFYLDSIPEKIIVSDTEINLRRLFEEKEKLKDIRNDIYNMTLSLKNTSLKIKEEIESYLLLDEISYAKERLKYVLRNSLMDAGFLNENIENSFNQDLYYINLQAILGKEIAQWKKQYSFLSQKLKDIDAYLKEKISEKEDLINLRHVLDQLERKIIKFSTAINRKINEFKDFLKKTLKTGYNDEKLSLIMEEFNKLKTTVNNFDRKIYSISQNIKSKEKKVMKRHKQVIDDWINIKDDLNIIFNDYWQGFTFFNDTRKNVKILEEEIETKLESIKNNIQSKISKGNFQEAFNFIQEETDLLLNQETKNIKELQEILKSEMKKKQKLFLLFRVLQDDLEDLEAKTIKLIADQVQLFKEDVTEERNIAQMKEFDEFVSLQIKHYKNDLDLTKNKLQDITKFSVKNITSAMEALKKSFLETNKEFQKKLDQNNKNITDFVSKSNMTIIQWTNFRENFLNEIIEVKNDFINKIISEKIRTISNEKLTNNIKIIELKKELNLKCNVLMDRIKDMIEISELNAELYEDKKCVLVFTEDYFKNKELKDYFETKIKKQINESIGKILALYDSSVKNKTLSINMLQLQNRLAEIRDFHTIIVPEFNLKIKELQINQKRKEFIETKEFFNSFIKETKSSLDSIAENLNLFNFMQNFITQEYNGLRIELMVKFTKIFDDIDKKNAYNKVLNNYKTQKQIIDEKYKDTLNSISQKIKESLNKNSDFNKLGPEIREYSVKVKQNFLNEYEDKLRKIENELIILRNEGFRGELMKYINNRKMHLSKLLGTLQKRVEDDIEIREFKKAYAMIHKRVKNIETKMKEVNKEVVSKVKAYNKETSGFDAKNKYLLNDFDRFLTEYSAILNEKVKTLERMIIKEYVEMAIKAVANEFLTISFLTTELKIKKQNIQDHLIFLISADQLKGKYDPRLGVYYENPEIFDELDETELEVIKNMNFKMYIFLRRLKSFTTQYGSIFALVASIITMIYYLFILSGGSPFAIVLPISISVAMITYYLLRKRKEDKP
ncbi:MAG: prenyltransferase/squalene oxidase repeat-containing protein [Promethearchaeota archaeon]